jgi:hypothetical protein
MASGGKGVNGAGWMVMLLPSVVVVLFQLLSLRLQAPTAGGLSFLAAVALAYWLFPKTRLSLTRALVGVLLAFVVALLLGVLLARIS